MARRQGKKRSRGSARKRRSVKAVRGRPRWLLWVVALGVTAHVVALFFHFRGPVDPLFERIPEQRDAGKLAAGQALYAEHCYSCHGALIEGQPNWKEPLPKGASPAPPHDETGHTWHHSDDYLFSTTKLGGQSTAPPGYVSAMPAFEGTLSDEEVWLVLDFIKSSWPSEIRARQRGQSH